MGGRRQPINTAAKAVSVMVAAAAGELTPPAHISVPKGALPFWSAIIRARPREEWEQAPTLLNAAANLAWTQWQIDQMRRMMDGEIAPPEGTALLQVASGLLKMQRLEMGYLRVLQQHGRAIDGEARDAGKRRALGKGIEDGSPFGDDLLARPSIQ